MFWKYIAKNVLCIWPTKKDSSSSETIAAAVAATTVIAAVKAGLAAAVVEWHQNAKDYFNDYGNDDQDELSVCLCQWIVNHVLLVLTQLHVWVNTRTEIAPLLQSLELGSDVDKADSASDEQGNRERHEDRLADDLVGPKAYLTSSAPLAADAQWVEDHVDELDEGKADCNNAYS